MNYFDTDIKMNKKEIRIFSLKNYSSKFELRLPGPVKKNLEKRPRKMSAYFSKDHGKVFEETEQVFS